MKYNEMSGMKCLCMISGAKGSEQGRRKFKLKQAGNLRTKRKRNKHEKEKLAACLVELAHGFKLLVQVCDAPLGCPQRVSHLNHPLITAT